MAAAGEDRAELDQLRNGREQAVATLSARYRERLVRMITLRLDDRVVGKVDADDILQDSFVEACRRIQDYLDHPSVPFYVWLRRITHQVLIDTHRRFLGAKMRDVNLEVALYRAGSAGTSSAYLVAQLADNLTTPSQLAAREELLCELNAALERLEEIDREVLVLRHLEELSNNDVAHILGIDKYAASKRYLRSLQRLRSAMPVHD